MALNLSHSILQGTILKISAEGDGVSFPQVVRDPGSGAAPNAWREGAAIGPLGALDQVRVAGRAASRGGKQTPAPSAKQRLFILSKCHSTQEQNV